MTKRTPNGKGKSRNAINGSTARRLHYAVDGKIVCHIFSMVKRYTNNSVEVNCAHCKEWIKRNEILSNVLH